MFGGQDAVREVCRRRMRHRVVRVHDVEPMLLCDPDDGRCESEQVLGLAK